MKLLTILTAVIFSLAILAPFRAYTCGDVAGASAWVTSSTSTAFSSINTNNAKSGGYSLSCTGNPSRSLSFTGSTYDSLNIFLNYRAAVSSSASVSGSCHGGGGFQNYDSASAGP